MIRGLVPAIGLMAALAPAWMPPLARAQTNLDQGKSAAQIFSGDCGECHKALRGLANGRNNAALTDFLVEHYTTSRQQAAALAAYVLGGRGSEPIGAVPGQGKKSGGRASATAEEAKPEKHQKSEKPEDGASAKRKPRQSTEAAAKPKEEDAPDGVERLLNPILRPERSQREQRPAAARTRHREPKAQPPSSAAAREPAAAGAELGRSEKPAASPSPPSPSSSASAAVPAATLPPAPPAAEPAREEAAPAGGAASESGESAPVPRDNIPD